VNEPAPAASITAPAVAVIENMEDRFAKVLPAAIAPVKFRQWCLTMIAKAVDPGTTEQAAKTAEAWRKVLSTEPGRLSVYTELMNAANLGLEPGREYHLIPFAGTVSGITDYKGEVRLITNARRCSVIAQLVRKADTFAMLGANVPPRHDAEWFDTAVRGPVTGGYAYVAYGGPECSMVITMGEAEFLHHREKARSRNVWDEWPEAMRLKTLVHQLRKWVPWSPEWQA